MKMESNNYKVENEIEVNRVLRLYNRQDKFSQYINLGGSSYYVERSRRDGITYLEVYINIDDSW
jgi:hypothetical protein